MVTIFSKDMQTLTLDFFSTHMHNILRFKEFEYNGMYLIDFVCSLCIYTINVAQIPP